MTQQQPKLTDRQRKALTTVRDRGPGPFAVTADGRTPAAVQQLLDLGYFERLNRLRPGLPVYEITAAGRRALEGKAP